MESKLSQSLELAAQGLAEIASLRAQKFEDERDLPRDFYDQLNSAGFFRILVPAELGGLGGTLSDWFHIVDVLSQADGATGWVVGHGAITSAIISALASRPFVESFFSDVNATAAWSNLARSKATEVEGGLLVDAQWGFVTGCSHADYLGGMVKIAATSDKKSKVVSVLVPRSEARIETTWDPVGLAGTGSHDVIMENVFVPWDRTLEWPRPWIDESDAANEAQMPVNPCAAFVTGTWPISICCAATQLGIARRALAEIRRELVGKRDSFNGKMVIEKANILNSLEEAEGVFIICQTAFESILKQIWNAARMGSGIDRDARINIRLVCVTTVHQCRAVVRTAFDSAGASALRKESLLQKLYRDASCLTSHVSASKSSFETTGKARYGIDKPGWL